MKIQLITIFIFINLFVFGQVEITGVVRSSDKEDVPFATVHEKKKNAYTKCNEFGEFTLMLDTGWIEMHVSAVGFDKEILKFYLLKDTLIEVDFSTNGDVLNEIVVSGTLSEISKRDSPISIEVYSTEYLEKVPTPSIFEATQNINGVRPQINCAVCNTGDIHINGMEGAYTMVTIDGMPLVGGLSTVYGLQGIPNSLLDRVEVVKGAASTLYGSEAVAGLVNVITKEVNEAANFGFETSYTTWNELQLDGHVKYGLAKKIKGLLGVSYYNYSNPIDKNGDNFTDLTLKDRISFFNKWRFERKDNRLATLLVRFMKEDRWGGEMQWNEEFRGTDSIYGESIYTDRVEVIGNYELPVKERLIFSGSYSFHDQDSKYGVTSFLAKQHIAYGQLVWHKKINTRNELLTGITTRYNNYDDNTAATSYGDSTKFENKPDNWILPGVFIQDHIQLNEKSKLLIGARYDYHQKHGSIFTPRFNLKIDPNEKSEIRFGYGSGFRVVNLFTEDHAALTGARDVVILELLKPEKSQNFNLNYVLRLNNKSSFITLDASVFYTYFSNKIIADYETNDQQIIYANLNGWGVSQGVSLNARLMFKFPLKINFGGTLLDVYTMDETTNNQFEKNRQLFAENYTGTWSISYSFSKLKMNIDYTGSLYGPMELPLVENDFRDQFSKPFSLQNIKLSKNFNSNLTVNIGVRNILNFTPPANSILRANDPFNKYADDISSNPNGYEFDPTYIYSSFQGINFFAGLKYNFRKKENVVN